MNNIIKQKITELQQLAAYFLYSNESSECYVIDKWQTIHSRITFYSEELYPIKGNTMEEEADICLALLMGYATSMCRSGEKVQQVLNRVYAILPLLDTSLLKCQLLVFCYGELYENTLLEEAHRIIESWKGQKKIGKNERRVIETLSILEKNNI